MLRFIHTFYLWLALFTACNAVSLLALKGTERLMLFPAAWVFQFPLVLAAALLHYGLSAPVALLSNDWKKRAQFALCVFCAFVFVGMYSASLLMYLQIDTFISWDAFRAGLSNAHQIVPDVIGGVGTELLWAGLISVVFGALYVRWQRRHCPRIFAVVCLAFLMSGAGGFAFVYHRPGDATERIRRDLLPTTYLTFSLIDSLLPSTSPTLDFLSDWALEPRVSLNEFVAAESLVDRPNVFFVLLESVPSDRFGFTGYERKGVSPNLDALAQECLVFPRTYAVANHSNYSQTSVHSSQYPLRRKKLDQFETVNYPKTMLFDILRYGGYRTAFFSAQNEEWQGMKRFIHADTEMPHFYHSKNELGNNIGIESKVADEVVVQRALEFLDEHDSERPVFMYLNLQATHFPYDIPTDAERPYQPCSTDGFEFSYTRFDEAHLDVVNNKFDNALRYVDAQVGKLINYLKEKELYDSSLIIVAPDHGEAFYKHGLPTHGTSLFEDQIRTVALFKLPAGEQAGVREDVISLIDINPTVLEILGLGNHPNFQGRPILHKRRDAPIYLVSHSLVKSHGIVDYPWKYFTSERDGERLSNLEIDPDEMRDFSVDQPERLNELKQALQVYQQKQLYYYSVLPQRERDAFYPPQH